MRVFFYALCHGEQLLKLCRLTPRFAADLPDVHYRPSYLFRMQDPFARAATLPTIHAEFAKADIIVYQKVGDNHGEWSTTALLQHARPGAVQIMLPNFYNTALFPLCKLGDYMGSKVFGEDAVITALRAHETATGGDGLPAVLADFRAGTLDWQYAQRFDDQLARMRADEAATSFRYVDFFLQHYQTHCLFMDALHPTTIFLAHIANQLLERFGYPASLDPFTVVHPELYDRPVAAYLATSARRHFQLQWGSDPAPGDEMYEKWIIRLVEQYRLHHRRDDTAYLF